MASTKPAGQAAVPRKGSNNASVTKSHHKKKKKTPLSSSPSSSKGNSPGNETPVPVDPRPVDPPPVSGAWGKPDPLATSVPPPVSGAWGKPDPLATSVPPPGFASSHVVDSIHANFSDAHVRLLRHRALFTFRFLVGKAVELRLVAPDERYAGILDCIDPDDFSVVLKNARRLASPRSSAGAKPFADGSTVVFRRHQLAHVVADGAIDDADSCRFAVASSGSSAAAAAAGGAFRTDTEISGTSREHLIGRQLEAASSWLDPALDTDALEDSATASALGDARQSAGPRKTGAWDQFEANEKLFGVVSTYDESMYTTTLDKSKISSAQARAAATLAQEIEQQTAEGNFHLQEERGQWGRGGPRATDVDEETRYSSVDRRGARAARGGGNVYVPPALRHAQHAASGDKLHDLTGAAKGTGAVPTGTAKTVASSTPEAVSSAPAVAVAAAAPKPLSFSEAVTGRSAPAPAPAAAPATAATRVAASTGVSKDEPEEKKESAADLQNAAVSAQQVHNKDSKSVAGKLKGAATKKKDVVGGNEKKTETKAGQKSESKPVSSCSTPTTVTTTSTSTTTTARKAAKDETSKAASKKGLNLNAKEFRLSASAAEFTPSFSVAPVMRGGQAVSPYHHGSPGTMPYPHPAMGYPPPMQEEWMYDGAMGVEEGGEMGMPPYMQGGYAMPMGPNGVPMMYSPIMPQQNMRMMGGQRGNYGGYQQQVYTPRGYCSPPNGGIPGAGVPFAGGSSMPGGTGPQPPLPPSSSSGNAPSEASTAGAPAPAASAMNSEVHPAVARSKQVPSASKKK